MRVPLTKLSLSRSKLFAKQAAPYVSDAAQYATALATGVLWAFSADSPLCVVGAALLTVFGLTVKLRETEGRGLADELLRRQQVLLEEQDGLLQTYKVEYDTLCKSFHGVLSQIMPDTAPDQGVDEQTL